MFIDSWVGICESECPQVFELNGGVAKKDEIVVAPTHRWIVDEVDVVFFGILVGLAKFVAVFTEDRVNELSVVSL